MNKLPVRVRFAPSPTGMMHLGNVRTALMNYLFAVQKGGTFIIRIEDTDFERNYDPQATQILADLAWLDLDYQEGPIHSGPHAPYFQSMRTQIYLDKLKEFEEKNLIYRCFCTKDELEGKRHRQLALKQPPRYDRTCLSLLSDEIQKKLTAQTPFIWRFKLNHEKPITVQDLAHGSIPFDMKSFSDIPLTRQDGSFTFMFANFIDDALMDITHVLRGEDHLSNTAGQVAMYQAAGFTPPLFWHLPIICNAQGAKLSKRDFGFSLSDLRNSGFLPEALVNYLAIIGGSFKQEILSLEELAQTMPFDHINPTSQIKYDIEKLKWLNHKWISRCPIDRLTELCMPYLEASFEYIHAVPVTKLHKLIESVRTDLTTLPDSVQALKFYFKAPILNEAMFNEITNTELSIIKELVQKLLPLMEVSIDSFIQEIKQEAQKQTISLKTLFVALRIALTSNPHGPNLHDIITMLGIEETKQRLVALTQLN